MNCFWIYKIIISFIFVNGYFTRDIYVNINKDYFPYETKLKILNSNLDVRHCKDLRNENNTVFLNISKELTSNSCSKDGVSIYIFVYYTNITSALITAKTDLNLHDIKQSLDNFYSKQNYIILKYQNRNYISFVKCNNNTPCLNNSVDQKLELQQLRLFEVYSACTETLQTDCVTTIEFTSKLIDIDSTNEDPAIIGSEINIKPSYSNSQSTNLNCRNGGILIAANYNESERCQCPNTIDFIETGPQCEVLQMSLKETQYFYVLPNSDKLIIELSVFSNGNQGVTSLMTIFNKDNSIFLKYVISPSFHTLQIFDIKINITQVIDNFNNVKWTSISITISYENVILKVNENSYLLNKKILMNSLRLDTVPIITGTSTRTDNKICMGYLKINSKLVDLYTPRYFNCEPACQCNTTTQKCIFVPFLSKDNSKCNCLVGLVEDVSKKCIKNDSLTRQIENGKSINIKLNGARVKFSRVTFRFRTTSLNGILLTLVLWNPINYNITIGISNSIISMRMANTTAIIGYRDIKDRIISDGKWHGVSLTLNDLALVLTLDSNYFNSIIFDSLVSDMICNMTIIGPLVSSSLIQYSKTTCFDTILLNSNGIMSQAISQNDGMTSQCDNGPQCPMLNCTENQKCNMVWQNSSCICRDYFVDQNGMCIFTKCVENPCKHGGSCSFDISNNNYKCQCINNYNGDNCDTIISSAGFQWWIILLVLLILLIILIVLLIYCCCYKKRNQPKNVADINKIQENTVSYNDPAGEVDFNGPINYEFLKYGNNINVNDYQVPGYPTNDLMDSKLKVDSNNNDLVLDQPLEYGFEGVNSETGSVSSLGSRSTDEQLNIQPLDYSNDKFDYLKNIYK